LSEKKAIIGLIIIVAMLITGIWAVEWRDRGTSVTPAPPAKTSSITKTPVIKAKTKVKIKVKKHKRVSRSHVRLFSAPTSGSNRRIGKQLAAAHGWSGEQWTA